MTEPGSHADRHERAREVFGRFVPGVAPDRVFASMEPRFGALGSSTRTTGAHSAISAGDTR
jgi:hypothetical protein